MGIARNHPVFNWIKCQGMLFHDTLNRVRKDSEEMTKTNPTWSGITPATKTWAWSQLKKLATDPYFCVDQQLRNTYIENLPLNYFSRKIERAINITHQD